MGSGKRMLVEFCGNGKYNKRLVTNGEAFVELEKYMDAFGVNSEHMFFTDIY